jgi:enamine deaminase RidA (YjgF/YER057c/UK114 family)
MSCSNARPLCTDLAVREVARHGYREWFATWSEASAADLPELARRLQSEGQAEPVVAEHFSPAAEADADLWHHSPTPLTWVLGQVAAPGLGGVYLHALSGTETRPVVLDGQRIGTCWDGPYATECLLAGLCATDTTAPRPVQARATYERMEEALALVGMDFSHVARTWLFLDDILSWYGEFNRVRTDFFTERGVFDRLVPASTGIGGSNPAGAAMITGLYAVLPRHEAVEVQAVPSPLQCPALQYGSSFSRAVEVSLPDVRRLLISGTASIYPDGRTAHVGDVKAQTALTCEVVEAILKSRGMDWPQVTRATAYVRHAADAGVLADHIAAGALPPLPLVVAHNVICRDDLLFELEVDAVLPVT